MLAVNDNIKIIHTDYLMDKVKENKLFKNVTQEVKEPDEQNHRYRLMKEELSDYIYSNKIILRLYLAIRNRIKENILNDTIKKYEEDNTQLLIIEGFDLLNFDIVKKIDFLILLKVPYHERINRILTRNGNINKKGIIEIDKKLHKNLKRKEHRNIDYIIENNGDIKKLQEQSKIILECLKEKDMSSAERFRKKEKILDFNDRIMKKDNVKEIRKGRTKNNDKEIY